MLITHVSDCFAPRTGGIESQVADLAAHQVAAGHEVHVLTATLGEGGERGGVVDLENGVHIHRLGARLPFELPVNPLGPRLIRDALRSLRPDVVHVHAGVVSPFAFDGARIALDLRLPTAVTWHCMLDGWVAPMRAVVGHTRWRRTTAALSAVSNEAASRVRDVFGAEVSVLPNGIDLDAWGPADPPPLAEGPLRLVATMRLVPRKRTVPLIELVGAAARRLPPGDVRLSIIGSGPAQASVAGAVSSRGLDDVVELRGRLTRQQVRAAYADAHLFLASAELEAFGIAALEARTAGLVVIARRGTGMAEFVEDGVDGFLVADDDAMADAVVRLATERPVLEKMLAHNRSTPPRFGWDDVLAAADREYTRARSLARSA